MRRLALAVSILTPTLLAAAPPRSLTLEDRAAARRAIEEVYWRHRTWPADNPGPKPSLDQVLPESAIRAKVEDDLRKSEALASVWSVGVGTAQLQAEMRRMAAQTRDGAMLRELFRALDDDPYVIAECLARPLVVDRLARERSGADDDGLIYVFSGYDGDGYVEWQPEVGPSSFNVYEGDLAVLKATGVYTQASGTNANADRHCHVLDPWVEDFEPVAAGSVKFALVSGLAGGVEGSLGTDSEGSARPNANPCP